MPSRAEPAQSGEIHAYQFDDLIIDVARRCVCRGGIELAVSGLSFDFLLALALEAPRVVTLRELMDRVWPGVVVSPETVSQRVKMVRAALEDKADNPRYIVGVRGRGYRLAVNVIALSDAARPGAVQAVAASPATSLTATQRRRTWQRDAIVAAVIGIVSLAATLQLVWLREPVSTDPPAAPTAPAPPPPRSIAVLPFANLTGSQENEYFGDGLADEMLTRLASVPGLHVVARTSSFHFKGRNEPVQMVGQRLRVRHVLEGSVRRQEDRIRITAQLIDTRNGYHVWARTFDRQLTDVFAIQDEIALAVVEELHIALHAEARAALLRRTTGDAHALDLYLRARHRDQEWRVDANDEAIRLYEEAIRRDPRFAAAYVGLAGSLMARAQIAELHPKDPGLARVPSLLRTALEIDPRSGDAHALLGRSLLSAYDVAGAERELRLAAELSRDGDHVLFHRAQFYVVAGWPPEAAIEHAKHWVRIDPLNRWAVANVAIAYWGAQQHELALHEIDALVAAEPDYWIAHFVRTGILTDLGRNADALASARRAVQLNDYADTQIDLAASHAGVGNHAEAREILRQLEDSKRGKYVSAAWRAHVLMRLQDPEAALDRLELAYDDRDPPLLEIVHWHSMLPLHGNPRFQRIVRLLGQERRIAHTARMSAGS